MSELLVILGSFSSCKIKRPLWPQHPQILLLNLTHFHQFAESSRKFSLWWCFPASYISDFSPSNSQILTPTHSPQRRCRTPQAPNRTIHNATDDIDLVLQNLQQLLAAVFRGHFVAGKNGDKTLHFHHWLWHKCFAWHLHSSFKRNSQNIERSQTDIWKCRESINRQVFCSYGSPFLPQRNQLLSTRYPSWAASSASGDRITNWPDL